MNYESLSKSTTPSVKHEIDNGIKSPEMFADDQSMTPISEYDIDDSHGHINPFTVTSQVMEYKIKKISYL